LGQLPGDRGKKAGRGQKKKLKSKLSQGGPGGVTVLKQKEFVGCQRTWTIEAIKVKNTVELDPCQ